jgi:hypothetical protein
MGKSSKPLNLTAGIATTLINFDRNTVLRLAPSEN